MEITKYTHLKFNLFNDTNNIYTTRFNILPNPRGQPILGMRFLQENNSVINLREGAISIDGTEYDVEIQNGTDSFENEVISKMRVYEIKDYKSEISDLIKNQRHEIPDLVTYKMSNIKLKFSTRWNLSKGSIKYRLA
ncbi:hypothetical protein DMUE_4104 [Dictyocoela muelleri]|nr:hypothetical protein DMUE_4104 [Dictyocoela muelleri]